MNSDSPESLYGAERASESESGVLLWPALQRLRGHSRGREYPRRQAAAGRPHADRPDLPP